MAQHVRTEVTIDAPASHVWAVLTDFSRYAEWNPFLVEAAGTAEVGAVLRLVMRNDTRQIRFRPTVTEARPGQSLEWLGRLVVPGIFDGRHRFDLRAVAEGTQVVHSERFSGVLAAMMGGLERDTHAQFERLNHALAARVATVQHER